MTASTVGYGDISPSSVLGKIAVIVYLTGGDHDDRDRDHDRDSDDDGGVDVHNHHHHHLLVGKNAVIIYLTGYYHHLPLVSKVAAIIYLIIADMIRSK